MTSLFEGQFSGRCPQCDGQMVITHDDEGAEIRECYGLEHALPCSPCGYQEPLPEDVRMLLVGAPTLPGFEVRR